VIVEELTAFRDAGGGSIVDLTVDGVGRDPEWLAGLARATGLHVVMGSGWYRGAYYPAEALIDRRSVDALADVIVRDATVGVGETGIRAGIIGEIGVDKPWLSAQEERVHRAAARAARQTGLAITTHAVQSAVGLEQLDVFEAEGADLTRVVIGHADSYPSLDYHLAIAERGATVEFDFLGMSFTPLERHGEPRIIDHLRELLARGHVERILLSQDVCHDSQLRRYGGHGYTYLAESFLPRLRDAGVSEDEIRTITIDNPRRLLTIA
jgi:phosphotriesterase-related protein